MTKIHQLHFNERNIKSMAKFYNSDFIAHVDSVLSYFDSLCKDWGNNIEVLLKILIERDKLYHIKFLIKFTDYYTDFKNEAEFAARKGAYDICVFFHKKGNDNINAILSGAIESQDNKIIEYALSNGAKYNDEEKVKDIVVKNKLIPIEFEKVITFNEMVHYTALLNKNENINNILYYFSNNQKTIIKIIKCSYIISGNIEAFHKLLSYDNTIDKDMYSLIVKYDREELFGFLNKNDINITELLTLSVINGSIRCLRYLYKNEDVKKIAALAALNNRLNIVKWSIEQGANNYEEILVNSIKNYNRGIVALISKYYKIDYYKLITTSNNPKSIIYACKKYLEANEKRKQLLKCIRTGIFNIALNDYTIEELNVSIYLATRYDLLVYVKSLFVLSQHMNMMFILINYYKSTKIIKWLKNTFKILC